MAMVEVSFPGNKKVDAKIAGHSVNTDQSVEHGGENQAPEPFQVFLASLATCAGIYAKSFCDQRDLPSPLSLEMDVERANHGLLSRIEIVLHVDAGFPDKYDPAIIRTMELCAVKKQLREEIETSIRVVRVDKQGT
ncbi:MAG: OsmC family protein [Candidatus Krumholzibacteria bacterium]|jgi:putative redox protein|nr:OsmC family protein [Candidatus Krumholzibacteria bacterium]MDH4335645.1 OsmC family protein [Candidatus Krumholzibacteria bacterium]MDH5270460.1 OsmC family protein [Candidatus Krumholzibacteria bacterium]MDH5627403.1 OsmC family protein [Candidatus Krumholzibacteria bacterium]